MNTRNTLTSKHLLLLSLLASCASAPALAQQTTLKVGISQIRPNSSSGEFSGPFTPSGISLDVHDKSTAFFSITQNIDENWGVELALGYPPTHDVALTINNDSLPPSAQALAGQVGARIRQVAPTVFLNYTFLEKTSAWRPFIGLGLNYTRFDQTSSTAAGNQINGGPTSISMEDSFGLALQGGISYQINPEWSLSATLATARVKSKITTNTLGIERSTDIKFRPTVMTVALGYSF
ncbi:outer membrane protein W [Polaromonas sp.]|nr:outer membrane protein W [Polaromonas sp.]